MVANVDLDYRYTVADEPTLDSVVSGNATPNSVSLFSLRGGKSLKSGTTGVVWTEDPIGRLARPIALISHEDDIRRLCGRYSQLRSDLSPLTSWCHLLTPKFFDPLDTIMRRPDLRGMEAAWIGLIVAEAMLSAEKPLSSVRISACLATQSFVIARSNSLWHGVSTEEALKRLDFGNQICRYETASERREGRNFKLRSSLQSIWLTLTGCLSPELSVRSEVRPLVQALHALQQARSDGDKEEAARFAKPLVQLEPEVSEFERLGELTPEMRLRLFDRLIERLGGTSERETARRLALTVLSAYLATVAAGGAPSLALAESHVARWPEITAWAYVLGGVGERVLWTSAFDGLGRLVARELLRPYRLDEPPTCDFSFEEVAVLTDPGLKDPLVNLKIKQARQVTMALFPGVNASMPLGEQSVVSKPDSARLPPRDPTVLLAENLWPHLKSRLDEYLKQLSSTQGGGEQATGTRNRGKRRAGPQTQLPLPGERDRN
jgi:hypothetical protein